jgi:hypothetical protein
MNLKVGQALIGAAEPSKTRVEAIFLELESGMTMP